MRLETRNDAEKRQKIIFGSRKALSRVSKNFSLNLRVWHHLGRISTFQDMTLVCHNTASTTNITFFGNRLSTKAAGTTSMRRRSVRKAVQLTDNRMAEETFLLMLLKLSVFVVLMEAYDLGILINCRRLENDSVDLDKSLNCLP